MGLLVQVYYDIATAIECVQFVPITSGLRGVKPNQSIES